MWLRLGTILRSSSVSTKPSTSLTPTSALITALHGASQDRLPITLIAAGLPQIVGNTGKARTYAERLFEFAHIDRLDEDAARAGLVVPAEKSGVTFSESAIDEVLARTECYPYFLQEWGKHCWNIAASSPVHGEDARQATIEALAELDAGFFRVRLERVTPTERNYLRAMAELGPGPHRSGDVARMLSKKVTSVAPTRNALIAKGMIYIPAHGDTAFTVPLFDGFIKRTTDWPNRTTGV